ncbi:HsdM family class I SAM-dependent methyltransferase [Moraxella atlantae]|uniref:site-specific DNA-methyltransferase (adenine-specific) n=1 Tax=Faucicola atlantae TaxID=34059 RepID=A0A378Q2Y8_9GAMM|nr:class I SAM-dependent DNA methyltransferase [Moraxella atlantae]OPH34268.1 DNA methyltransferase [Moraxella atlantae]STY95129.1 Probable type I restriction enzyme BthVORF4518P M protein [Moraxella atlantae]
MTTQTANDKKPTTQNNQSQAIVSKVWNFCHMLRDDGVSYGDYLEQITYLIFLKMAHEYSQPLYKKDIGIPTEYNWQSLTSKTGSELEAHYLTLLRNLSKKSGLLGQIFTKAQNKIQDPAKLSRLIDMINETSWAKLGSDVKGDIYEGILEKNAEDTKSGAGQYFTPRALIQAIVHCMQPKIGMTIADPACGTGGFLLSAYDYITHSDKTLDTEAKQKLKHETFSGNEIVANTRRLCLMNLFLHGIGEMGGESPISSLDALVSPPKQPVDMVLANPPFGKKSSMTITNEEGELEKEDFVYNRQDFWATTSNKQVNFLQHIYTMLKQTGKAGVVVPDNVLFEGGAGETVRKNLLEKTDLHTILRLPTGIFYANGVKANVLFFDNHTAQEQAVTKEVWIYDYRTNIHHTLKKKPMTLADLQDFIDCYNPKNRHDRKETYHAETNPDGRWRKFSIDDIKKRDKTSLDIFWLKDNSLTDLDNLPEPEELANDIIENIEAGLASFRAVLSELEN